MPETNSLPELTALRARVEQLSQLDAEALAAEHIALLGRKGGALTELLRRLPELPVEERRRFGADVNALKARAEELYDARRQALEAESSAQRQAGIDLTMPSRASWVGAEHPVNQVIGEICEIFRGLGFSVAIGPEIETEWYNFGSLNFPPDHPAMDLHDTLYLDAPPSSETPGGKFLLRTHTSPVQIRSLLASPPPVRIVAPGMCYRSDAFDASHAPAFAQIEGLAVDEGISLADLKATLLHFVRRFFHADIKARFRPSYFPFTEPSGELDIECLICHGSGCSACKGSGWMEILGCGVVHPRVLEHCGVDAEKFSGFAFGMGPARITMLRHGIPDIRQLYRGDMRVLSQFVR